MSRRTALLCLLVFIQCRSWTEVAPAATNQTNNTELEYERLLELDDAALEETDRWIREEEAQSSQGGGIGIATLRARVQERFRPVREAYDRFLLLHPDHAKTHLAYGSFLMETGDEESAVREMETSRRLDPTNPAAWNNLANHYGHRGPVSKSFEYYSHAIELQPKEPVYYQNLATTTYLFRQDAMAYYHLTEPQVFAKALDLYRQAIALDPTNFVLASDYAQSFYGIRPSPTNAPADKEAAIRKTAAEAIEAWQAALKSATDNLQREGVYVHIARNLFLAGRYPEARTQLQSVTNQAYHALKSRLLRNLDAKNNPSPAGTPDYEQPEANQLRPEPNPKTPDPQIPLTKDN